MGSTEKSLASGSICAGHEQQCVSLRSELVGNLLVGDRVDGHLDLASWHAGVKDPHVRSKIRRRRANQTERSKREQTTKSKATWQMHNMGGNWGMLWEEGLQSEYVQAMRAVQEWPGTVYSGLSPRAGGTKMRVLCLKNRRRYQTPR